VELLEVTAGLFRELPAFSPDGDLTFEIKENVFGAARLAVTLQDSGGTLRGSDSSETLFLNISVDWVNVEPSFSLGALALVPQNAAPFSQDGFATDILTGPPSEDVFGQALTFRLELLSGRASLFTTLPTISPNGTLSFATAPFLEGQAIFGVTLADDGGTANGGRNLSENRTLNVTVVYVNQPPSFSLPDLTTLLDAAVDDSVDWFAFNASAAAGAPPSASAPGNYEP